MALLGEKCSRCGKKRTKHVYDGLPTCEPCEELIQKKLQAQQEMIRQCPIDSVAMSKEIILNIVVDRCPSCHGVWLDGGELELLRGAVEAGLAVDFARRMALPY